MGEKLNFGLLLSVNHSVVLAPEMDRGIPRRQKIIFSESFKQRRNKILNFMRRSKRRAIS